MQLGKFNDFNNVSQILVIDIIKVNVYLNNLLINQSTQIGHLDNILLLVMKLL